MPSIIKVDQIQSDLGTVNVSSNLQFSSGFTMRSPTIATPTFTGQATIPTINLTGGQIAFPATKNPSSDPNTLDDYEEGTWSPTITYSTTLTNTNPSTNAVLANRGIYTKIGNIVTLSVYLQRSDIGSDFILLAITLPFTAANIANTNPAVAMSCYGIRGQYGSTTVTNPITNTSIPLNTSFMSTYVANDTTGAGFLVFGSIGSASFTATYRVA